MHTRTLALLWTLPLALPGQTLAESVAPAPQPAATPADSQAPTELRWSLGWRLKADDLKAPGQLNLMPMIGVRYGRWRIGAVDGETWHRFAQVKTDSTLTYDWLNNDQWRTSLSASLLNLQNDGTMSMFEPGTKTARGKATIDYVGWSHWSVGLVLMHDMLGRGGGTSLSPSLTWRESLSEDSTLLLSQSVTWGTGPMWATSHRLSPGMQVRQGTGWGSLDGTITLRQHWKPQWSWYSQLGHSRALGAAYPDATQARGVWSAQAGVIYFDR